MGTTRSTTASRVERHLAPAARLPRDDPGCLPPAPLLPPESSATSLPPHGCHALTLAAYHPLHYCLPSRAPPRSRRTAATRYPWLPTTRSTTASRVERHLAPAARLPRDDPGCLPPAPLLFSILMSLGPSMYSSVMLYSTIHSYLRYG